MGKPSFAVVKIGGSILTAPSITGPRLREEHLDDLISDLRACRDRLVLVHGSGAFGKPPALQHGYVGSGKVKADASAMVCAVTEELEWLNAALLRRLRQAGMRPMVLPPASLFAWKHGAVMLQQSRAVRDCCDRGLVPVIGSGFVPDLDDGGFAVCSSDEISAQLAVAMNARVLIFATNTPGVYSNYPEGEGIFSTLSSDDAASLSRIVPDRADVSGGMAAKVKSGLAAARHDVAVYIVDGRMPHNLRATLSGNPLSGTRLLAGPRSESPPESIGTLSVDSLRKQIDGEMQAQFEKLTREGPMSQDLLVRQVYRWAFHYLENGGKRMHGICTWLAYAAFGGQNVEAIRKVAAAIQLYHHHTMVHDDIYDEDVARRGWATTHIAFAGWFAKRQRHDAQASTRLFGSDSSRRGVVSAIAYGKIVHALALYGIGTAGFPEELTLEVSDLLNWHDLFDNAGQLKDVDFEGRQIPSSQICLSNAWLKTGRLFEVCARIGAVLAGADGKQQDAVARWAGNAGLAYQIQDDLEDIVDSSEKGQGRGIGVDLLYCKPTYLYALTRELAAPTDLKILDAWQQAKRTMPGVAAIVDIIRRSGAQQQVERKVSQLLEEGQAAIRSDAVRVTGDVADAMEKFARYFVSPQYWRRPILSGSRQIEELFASDEAGSAARHYPASHRDSEVHGYETAIA